MNITVDRNAFGPQIDSFHETAVIKAISDNPLELTFIRAPQITAVGDDVRILHRTNGTITAAETDSCLATSFHPELSGSTAFHKYFTEKCGLSVRENSTDISEKAWMQRKR
jgi:5'-phosphate synthase pdxT subunit